MPRAVSLTEEILKNFAPHVESLTLLPSSGGRFEVIVDDQLIFSKKQIGRHAQPGEVLRAFQDATGLEPIPRDD